jgi:hypothetical protein
VDAELNGQPDPEALGDDILGDDEDGVVPNGALVVGQDGSFIITASAGGRLDAWVDFDRDSVWEAEERIAHSFPLLPGLNLLGFTVPDTALGGNTFARFRLSPLGGLDPDGPAEAGEVEDHLVAIAEVPPEAAAEEARTILLRNPAENGASISFVLAGEQLTLEAGQQLRLEAANPPIEFDSGSERQRYALVEGMYDFTRDEEEDVWNLHRQTNRVTLDNSANTTDFSYLADGEESVVPAGGIQTHESRFPVVVTWDQGGGKGTEQLALSTGDYKIGVNPKNGGWGLFQDAERQ